MGFDKAIKSGKEHRKPYRGSKAIDYTCHNHGSCPWCETNRQHNNRKRRFAADEKLKWWELELLEDQMSDFTGNHEFSVGDFVVDTCNGHYNLIIEEIDSEGFAICVDPDGTDYEINVSCLEHQG